MLWGQRRIRSQNLESHEHEGAQQGSAVGTTLQNADDATLTAETLFSEIQEQHEAVLAAGLQDPGHAEVHHVVVHNSLPTYNCVLGEINLELNFNGVLVLALQDLVHNLLL